MPAVATGPRQVDIFEEEGVDLSRVQIAHCGDTDDVGYIEKLIERGVYVGLDRYGLELLTTEAKVATLIQPDWKWYNARKDDIDARVTKILKG